MPDSRDTDVFVAALGASTAVGRSAWSSAAAVRAGISGFTEHGYLIDSEGEPIRIAAAPWLDAELEGSERVDALLIPAIQDALGPVVSKGARTSRVGLALGLPSPRPGVAPDLAERVIDSINRTFGATFGGIATFSTGHAGGLQGMHAAAAKLVDDAFDACVVAGVDSYLNPETLEWLEDTDRIHGAGPLNNAWGFVPGEGAGAVLLATGRWLHATGVEPLAVVAGTGIAFERQIINTETVCIGEGLTEAFRATLGRLPPGVVVTDVYCDMNGEPYRADEYGFACLRTKEWFASASDFVAPADCWGDTAAASGPLGVILAVVAGRKAYSNGHIAFVWASSETGERGGVTLRTIPLALHDVGNR